MTATRVLVIDDDEASLLLLVKMLRANGMDVVGRRIPPSAAEVVSLNVVAIVFDLHLGATGGDHVALSYHVVRELRDVSFVLVSADPEGLGRAASRTPWLHCVQKGPSVTPIVDKVRTLVDRRSAASGVANSGMFALAAQSRAVAPRNGKAEQFERLPRDTQTDGHDHKLRDTLPDAPDMPGAPNAPQAPPTARGSQPRRGSAPEGIRSSPRTESQPERQLQRDTRPDGEPSPWAPERDTNLQRRPPLSSRDQLRGEFVVRARGAAYSLRGFLRGVLLEPRAHKEVTLRMSALRDESPALLAKEPCLNDVISLCLRLSVRAQHQPEAMQALSACVGWLSSLDERMAFPRAVDDVPPLREARRIAG